jgi:hypothetical protein
MTNYEWLKSICGEQIKDSAWHDDLVLRVGQICNPNIHYRVNYIEEYINPANIIGIDYGFVYNFNKDISWIYFLNNLRRFPEIRRKQHSFDSIVEHITSDKYDQKCVCKFGEKYFTFNGQHRMCLAKFMGLSSVKVLVHEYIENESVY